MEQRRGTAQAQRSRIGRAARRGAQAVGLASLTALVTWGAAAQTEAPPAMGSAEALEAMPDPQRYDLEVLNEGLQPDAVHTIGQMVMDVLGEEHFFGAVHAYLPDGSQQMRLRIRGGLHSLEVAERLALRDCEEDRDAEDSPCRLLATIRPEGWDAETGLSLSSDAVAAFRVGAAQMDPSLFLARSRETASFAVWGGEGARQSALDECNGSVEASGEDPDCEIVVDDLAAPDQAP